MNAANKGTDYSSCTAPVGRLAMANTNDMARLWGAKRGDGAGAAIQRSLERREQALLVHAGERLAAFATYGIVEAAWHGAAVCALCMSDVLHADEADSRALGLEWLRYAGRVHQRRPQFALYWLLVAPDDRTLALMSGLVKSLHVLDPDSTDESDLFTGALANAALGPDSRNVRICLARIEEANLKTEARRAFGGAELSDLRAA